MANCRTKLLIVFIICLFNCNLCFSHEKIDSMCGIWVHVYENNFYDTLAIEKISFSEYLIVYTCSYDHVHDMLEKSTVVSKNLLYIKRSDEEEFFIYLDYDKNSVYFLWNHAFPDAVFYDTELKRGIEVFNDELAKTRQKEFDERLRKSILDSFTQ